MTAPATCAVCGASGPPDDGDSLPDPGPEFYGWALWSGGKWTCPDHTHTRGHWVPEYEDGIPVRMAWRWLPPLPGGRPS